MIELLHLKKEMYTEYNTPYGAVHICNFPKYNSISLSGGFDSAVVLYMLAKTLNGQPDAVIFPYTVRRTNPTNDPKWDRIDVIPYVDKIIDFVRSQFPDVEICNTEIMDAPYWWVHQFENGRNIGSYSSALNTLKNYYSWKYGSGILDYFPYDTNVSLRELMLADYTGITSNPPDNELHSNDETERNSIDTATIFSNSLSVKRTNLSYPWSIYYEPLRNYDKRLPVWLANSFGVLDNLMSVTRSCEGDVWNTENFTKECHECWWCKERQWAYNKFKSA